MPSDAQGAALHLVQDDLLRDPMPITLKRQDEGCRQDLRCYQPDGQPLRLEASQDGTGKNEGELGGAGQGRRGSGHQVLCEAKIVASRHDGNTWHVAESVHCTPIKQHTANAKKTDCKSSLQGVACSATEVPGKA